MSPPSLDEDYEALIQFLYLAPVGLVQASMDGEIIMINPISAQLLMPLAPTGDLSNLFKTLESVAPELRHLCGAFVQPYGKVCDALRLQVNAGQPGVTDPQVLSLTVLKLDETRLMAVLDDVTVQVKRERQLRQNEVWFNAILTGITDYALVSLDRHGCIEGWNASIGRVHGFTDSYVQGKPYSVLFPADATTPDALIDRLHDADQNGWSLVEGYCINADGSRFWASTMITPLHERDLLLKQTRPAEAVFPEPSYCLVVRDISDKREASERNRLATSCDFLTGIANRRAFFEAAELELERKKRTPRAVSLILFDADNFKRINDRFGHPVGDAVLRHFAVSLTETFRQVDVVARVGGEEFAVLLPSTDLEGACKVADRLRALVASSAIEIDGNTIHYTVSGGVATMELEVSGLDGLMKRADQALYAAKARGRNCIEHWAPE